MQILTTSNWRFYGLYSHCPYPNFGKGGTPHLLWAHACQHLNHTPLYAPLVVSQITALVLYKNQEIVESHETRKGVSQAFVCKQLVFPTSPFLTFAIPWSCPVFALIISACAVCTLGSSFVKPRVQRSEFPWLFKQPPCPTLFLLTPYFLCELLEMGSEGFIPKEWEQKNLSHGSASGQDV